MQKKQQEGAEKKKNHCQFNFQSHENFINWVFIFQGKETDQFFQSHEK